VAAVAPSNSKYVPALQFEQTEAPSNEYLPATQLMQLLAAVAPVVAEYLPATHGTQVLATVAATAVEYLPAAQSVQSVAAACENLPAAQLMHAAEPDPGLYSPARHKTHICPSPPVDPGLHLQSERNSEAWEEFELAGQS
jgi:hypothetical protein